MKINNRYYYLFYRFYTTQLVKNNPIPADDIAHHSWGAVGKMSIILLLLLFDLFCIYIIAYGNDGFNTILANWRLISPLIFLFLFSIYPLQLIYFKFRGRNVEIVSFYQDSLKETEEEREEIALKYRIFFGVWIFITIALMFAAGASTNDIFFSKRKTGRLNAPRFLSINTTTYRHIRKKPCPQYRLRSSRR